MADYDWFDRTPTEADKTAAHYRKLGFAPKFASGTTMSGGHLGVKYYLCERGCGTLVWSPEDHMKNVCTDYAED